MNENAALRLKVPYPFKKIVRIFLKHQGKKITPETIRG